MTPPADPPTTTLLFPSLSPLIPTLSTTLRSHRLSTLSIPNRLSSIRQDSRFVLAVAAAYNDRPLIANERCGAWYIPPERKGGSVYFKSTDGHAGVWGFSTRRLGVGVMGLIGERDGAVVVDSTRRGKSMPDALSKTVPIWCAVWNRVLFPELGGEEGHRVYTPPMVVGESERAQIEDRLEGWVKEVLALDLDLEGLKRKLKKPMRPLWVTQKMGLPEEVVEVVFEDYHPIVCCTASKRVLGDEASEGGYIQGAGDDSEGWACGLTPALYWANAELLRSTPAAELSEVIANLVAASTSPIVFQASKGVQDIRPIPPTSTLHLLPLSALPVSTLPTTPTILVTTSTSPAYVLPAPLDSVKSIKHTHLPLPPLKLGSRQLRVLLPSLITFIQSTITDLPALAPSPSPEHKAEIPIFVAHPDADLDHAIGIALAVLVLYFDDRGDQKWPTTADERAERQEEGVTKQLIRKRLNWILQLYPEAKVARATLGSVNEVLMGRPG